MNEIISKFAENDPWRIILFACLIGMAFFWIVAWLTHGPQSPDLVTLSPYEIAITLTPKVPL